MSECVSQLSIYCKRSSDYTLFSACQLRIYCESGKIFVENFCALKFRCNEFLLIAVILDEIFDETSELHVFVKICHFYFHPCSQLTSNEKILITSELQYTSLCYSIHHYIM